MARTANSPTVYLDYLRSDAAAASTSVPTLADMQRKFAYHADDSTRSLAPGDPPIDVAGLRLHLEVSGRGDRAEGRQHTADRSRVRGDDVVEPRHRVQLARALPFDAMVVRKGSSETRTECVYRTDARIVISKVETVELPPLSSYYMEHVPPSLVGLDERIARGHRPSGEVCSEVVSQAVRTGIERHEIGWRDLVDFYARHRCQTYQFPTSYRALTADGERPIPAVDARM